MHPLVFASILLISDLALNFTSSRILKFLGIDLLFFSSWLSGIKYGILDGFIISLALLLGHSIVHINKNKFILFSLPAQFSAVILGYFLGESGFLKSLLVYQLINTGLMVVLGGIGPLFLIFLLTNTAFNIILYKIWVLVF